MLNRNVFDFNLQLFADDPAGTESQADEAQSIGGETEQAKVYPEDYVKKLRAESAGYRAKHKELENKHKESENTFNKKLNSVFEALGINPDPDKNYEKQISDWKSKAQESETKAQETEKRANNKLIKAEIKSISSSLGIISADAAYKLMDLSEIKVKDDGTVKGVKEALEELIKENPFLKNQQQPPRKVGGPSNPGGVTIPETDADKMNRAIRMAAGYLPRN